MKDTNVNRLSAVTLRMFCFTGVTEGLPEPEKKRYFKPKCTYCELALRIFAPNVVGCRDVIPLVPAIRSDIR